jgi:hypothetical protein
MEDGTSLLLLCISRSLFLRLESDWRSQLNGDALFRKFLECFEYVDTLSDAMKLSVEQLITMGVDARAAAPLFNKIQSLRGKATPVQPLHNPHGVLL